MASLHATTAPFEQAERATLEHVLSVSPRDYETALGELEPTQLEPIVPTLEARFASESDPAAKIDLWETLHQALEASGANADAIAAYQEQARKAMTPAQLDVLRSDHAHLHE